MQKLDAAEAPQSTSEHGSNKLTITASIVVCLLAIINLYHLRIADADLWWYLRCGEDILRSGQIRQVDTYSFTAAGLPYLNHEWLSQVLFAFLFQHGGSLALVLAKIFVGIALLVVMYRLVRIHTSDARVYLPLLLLGAHVVGRFLLLRPQIFSFLFFAVTLYLLELNRRRETKLVWLLPFVLWLWANMHAAFPVGIVLIGFYWLAMPWAGTEVTQKLSAQLGLVLFVAVGLTLVNPYGVALWSGILEGLLDPLNKTYVNEWRPTYLSPFAWNGLACFGMIALACICAAAARVRNWAELLIAVLFALLALSAPRHVPFFAVVMIPLLAKWITAWQNGNTSARAAHIALAGGLGVVLIPVLLTAFYTVIDPLPRIRIRDMHYRGFPYQAANFLRQQPAGGNVWNELAWGGYFLWKLSPEWKVSLDGRNMAVYPRAVVKDHLELLSGAMPDVSVLSRYPIDVCAISRERKLVPMLKASRDWELIYEDEVAVIFRSKRSQIALLTQKEINLPPRPIELFVDDVLK